MNINNPTTFAAPDLTFSTSNSSGTSGALRADDTVLLYDTTVPGTIAASASAATGSAATSARRDHVHGSAAAYTTFAAPSFTLGTSNISGSGNSVHAGATLLAFDTTVPTTIASTASAAVGSAVVAARRDHTHGAPVIVNGWEFEDIESTEFTSTSESPVDGITLVVSIAATLPIMVVGNARKSGGGVGDCTLGLKLNATVVGEAINNDYTANGKTSVWSSLSPNAVNSGAFTIMLGARVTNYLRAGTGTFTTIVDSVNGAAGGTRPCQSADMPTATITAIIIRMDQADGANTGGIDEIIAYSGVIT